MTFENERPDRNKVSVWVEIIVSMILVIITIYTLCMEVGATSVSDGNAIESELSNYSEGKEGFFIVKTPNDTIVYVPEGFSYWLVWTDGANYYSYVSADKLYLCGSCICMDRVKTAYVYDSDGTYVRAVSLSSSNACEHGRYYGRSGDYNAVAGVVSGNYLSCSDGGFITPAPDVTKEPETTIEPTEPPVSTAFPMVTEVPFFQAKPEDLSTTNILLLFILIVQLADFILKRIGGIFKCTK